MTDRDILIDLVKAGEQFRRTPIVDDDFPAYRDRFDRRLDIARRHLDQPRPKVVTLCGSTRFYQQFQEANYRLTMDGHIVLSVGHYPRTQLQLVTIDGGMGPQEAMVPVAVHGEHVGCTPEQKVKLDELHKRKIDLSDEVYVLNVGGYVGESTRSEIDHAVGRGIPVRYLEPV
jgi:hypothetical protein